MTAVVPNTRMVSTYVFRKFSAADATVNVRADLDFYTASQTLIRSPGGYRNTTISSDTTNTSLTVTCEVPANAYFARVRIVNRTPNTATNFLIESCQFNNDDPYVIFGTGFDSGYTSMVRPNRRVKVHSLMGGNILPRWIASPVIGEEAHAPNNRVHKVQGPGGEQWWTHSYETAASPPAADTGTTAFRFKLNKAIANTVTGIQVGSVGVYTQAPVYSGHIYRVRFWARSAIGTPPAGHFRLDLFDRGNNDQLWASSNFTHTLTGTWFRFDQTFIVPADCINGDLRISMHFGDTVLSQNVAADYAFELMGMQIQDISTDTNPVDYAYGDGAEPVFNGYAEKWSSSNYSPYGNQEMELSASDDFRIFSDTTFPNPVKAGYLVDENLVTYMPFDDPAGSSKALDGRNSTLGGGDILESTDGEGTITFGVAGFVGGEADGTCVQFSANADPAAGSWFKASGEPEVVTDPSWKSLRLLPDTGFQLSFWFKVPAADRPPNGSHYGVFAASRLSDGASTHLVSCFGDANGDYIFTRWGAISSGFLVNRPRGSLYDGNPHFVVINGAAKADPTTGGRSISVYIDGTLVGSSTTPAGSVAVPNNHYVGGSHATDLALARWQFVGFLSHVSLSASNTLSVTDRWNAKAWEKSPSKTGGAVIGYIARCVNPSRYANYDGDGGVTGFNILPAAFSNVSALSVLQDVARDLRGFMYANRDGRITWYNRTTVAALLNATPKVGNSAVLDFSQGEGPEPGWSYETEISRIYNYVEGTHVNTGNVYTNIDTESITRFGRRPYTFESRLSNPVNVETQVDELLGNEDGYHRPRVQLSDITWNLAANWNVAAKILRLDLLGIATLSNLPDYAPWKTVYLQVEKIQHQVSVSGGTCEWNTTVSVFNVGTPVNHDWVKPVRG
ncbi:LamG domain-containing protein [Streptomyces cadmiisoli]|uniref:LamG domain-containing protein n=1 Tax=Streptomyces cadmiisoli TaxID=2184053 RepID=UPI0013A6B522|nr:LamG domain-containing protein [Streptomyces cadmiisoli]